MERHGRCPGEDRLRFVYQNPELEAALAAARTWDDLDVAMRGLRALVPSFLTPEIRGRRLFWPSLDAQIPKLAARLGLTDVGATKSNDNVVVLATRFYGIGGHSKIGADILRILGRERCSLVFTDADATLRWRGVINSSPENARYQRRSTVILSAPTLPEKIVELYMILAAIRPTRIFLLQNHMDVVASVGAWPFHDVVDFIHHADHMPALGATLPFSGHVDPTYTCHRACREAGLDPSYSGMTLEPKPAAPRAPASGGRLRFATCASLEKYRHRGRHRWSDFVVAALKPHDAEFIHIGPFDDAFVAEMHADLAAAGLEPRRYRFVGPVPDLRETLVSEGVDVFVANYPDGGGRANLEAMDVGLPPIVPLASEGGELTRFDSPLPDWLPITEPEQMAEAIERALALRPRLRTPEGRAALEEEFARFERFVLDPALGRGAGA